MITPDAFDFLTSAVAELNGLDDGTAGQVVAAVGDTPMIDQASGKIVASLPDGRELLVVWPEEEGA